MASELEKAVNKLVQTAPGYQVFLGPQAPADPVPAPRGVGRQQAASGGASGIASPLTERGYTTRTYYPSAYVTSSDGLFTFQALKTMSFTDAGGAAVQFVFSAPP